MLAHIRVTVVQKSGLGLDTESLSIEDGSPLRLILPLERKVEGRVKLVVINFLVVYEWRLRYILDCVECQVRTWLCELPVGKTLCTKRR